MDKIITRNCAKFIRSKLNMYGISKCLTERIAELDEFQQDQTVMLYYPKEDELDLTELYTEKKEFFLPRIEKGKILVCPWDFGDKLTKSSFNVYEPLTEPVDPQILDLIIMPGLCADVNKNRIGYGKGCYDEFLTYCNAKTIFALPDELLFNSVPTAIHDIKPEIIITPTKIIQ